MTTGTSAATVVRPLREDDVESVEQLAWDALDDVGQRLGFVMGARDANRIRWAQARIRHLAGTDPGGSVVAERDGELVGIGLAIKRGSLWFLSLLAVRLGLQGDGIGRQLLDATLAYGADCRTAMICASPDPRALRRYGRAGFALHPGFEAVGVPARGELPADLGVREGSWDRDTDLVEQLITERRGEPYGPDLAWCRTRQMRILVRDGGTHADRAIALTSPNGGRIGTLAGASEDAAARVLWAAIAEAPDDVTVGFLTGSQQWAIDVSLAARLRLQLTDAVCTRGFSGPPAPYLPFGVFG